MAAPATSVKLFNKWSFEDVTVADLSLKDYIAIDKQASSISCSRSLIHCDKLRVSSSSSLISPFIAHFLN
jgi:hypothetical protein